MSSFYSALPEVDTLVSLLQAHGVRHVVTSPGSRNAPIALTLASQSFFKCTTVLDERSAAFMALGMAQTTGETVAICCTSGSALLNYAPALAEAYYQRLPILVISADRPAEWIDQGEGQTIRQHGALRAVVAGSFNTSGASATHLNRVVNESLLLAAKSRRPVHLNVPLAEPLYVVATPVGVQRRVVALALDRKLADKSLQSLLGQWERCSRIAVVIAQGPHEAALLPAVNRLMADGRVAVLTETTANHYAFGAVSAIDRTLERVVGKANEQDFVPELVITVGANIVSKKWKSFLRKNRGLVQNHWHFGDEVLDTFQCLTHLIDAPAASVLGALPISEISSGFGSQWKQAFYDAEHRHHEFLRHAPFSDLTVFQLLYDWIPVGTQVQMGNSTVVRYFQLFGTADGLHYYGNRGVSGIDGCLSTAIGMALTTSAPVLHVSGDLAVRYDAAAFSFKSYPPNLRVVVVNNGGGNIFRIVDGAPTNKLSEQVVETVREESVLPLAEAYGLRTVSCLTAAEFETCLQHLFEPDAPQVIEVRTPRLESPIVLKNYFNFISHG